MADTNRTGSGREIALLVGVLLLVAVGTIATYWARTQAADAASGPAAAPTDPPVVHADIYFDFKSTRLGAEAVRLLQDKAALVERSGAWTVVLHGYADRHGPAEYNKRLARQRADAVRQFLVELGVPEPSIKVVTIGQEGALCDDPSAECQRLNRRVHLEMRKLRATAAREDVGALVQQP